MPRLLLHQGIAFLLVVAIVLTPLGSQADTELEIKHLFEYIQNSTCIFVRNGKKYNARETLAHIQKKYEYAKLRITSAEDFIKYTVTKSSLSGQPYQVLCDERKILSAEWFMAELKRFRGKNLK
ncbi:MAG: DUF5329 family protein [Desulfobacteraceae bacterium]|nr:DUF5329 family protein [Desulfobacteraceae bacterium]